MSRSKPDQLPAPDQPRPRVVEGRERRQQRGCGERADHDRHGDPRRGHSLRLGFPNTAGRRSPDRDAPDPKPADLALLAAAALGLGACSATSEDTGGGPTEPATEGITLYSGRIPAAIGGAVDMYEAEADRDVQVRYGDTGRPRRDPDRGGRQLPRRRLLRPGAGRDRRGRRPRACWPSCRRTSSTGCRREYRDPEGRWVGVTGRARVIAYGPSVERVRAAGLAARPHRPEWKGRVGWAPASDSLQQYVTALRLALRRRRRARLARGHGRQRRRRLSRQRLDPRRDRQRRDRRRADQPLLRGPGGRRGGPRLPGRGLLPDRRASARCCC